ncbi:hypothetical protein DKT75_12615 [Leucothrix arctica]|uniref:Uncharacterized protein n=2 Tax=Leucothrix arctica TaxID=1481894 RepID=A0A317C9G2_9GAMM|nr:hypothetical protein DKT75_12615 [Leucothrix arctica]
MLANPNDTPVEQLQTTLTYLMTRYSSIITFKLPDCAACFAVTIVEHLNLILAHPKVSSSSTLRDTYMQLQMNWELLASHAESEHPANQTLMREAKQSGALH